MSALWYNRKMIFTILGAGAWGRAFGQILADGGHQVKYWSISTDELKSLPGELYETNIKRAVEDADIIVAALPCAAVKSVMEKLNDVDLANKTFISLSKGICGEKMQFADEIIAEILDIKSEQVYFLHIT